MSGIIKWIAMIVLFVVIGTWIFTVAKSCNPDNDPLLENAIPDDIDDGLSDGKAKLDDLYEDGAEKMSDLKREAIEAKDRLATKAQNATDQIFEADEEDIDDAAADAADERAAINAKRDQLNTKNGSSADRGSSAGNSGSSTGQYFVIAGSYLQETNAKAMVKALKRAGYRDAEVVVFDLSQYYSVFARRYNSYGSANSLAKAISAKMGVEAYVHEKRARYQNR